MSITGASVNDAGQLLISFSDGRVVNLDKITVVNGKDGVSVTKSEINPQGELVLTYSNGCLLYTSADGSRSRATDLGLKKCSMLRKIGGD